MTYQDIGAFPRRVGGRPPLRSQQELADEFGVSLRQLAALLAHRNGPKPVKKKRRLPTYYNPEEVRSWWQQIKEQPHA